MQNRLDGSTQRLGGILSIISAILFVVVMFLLQPLATIGVTGSDVYERTVNSSLAHPILNWLNMLIGVLAILLLFWTVEALEQRIRFINPKISSNMSRMAYIYLMLYSLYMLLPVKAS